MTTRILLFNADGDSIGSISPTMLAALIDSGLLNRENTPAASLTPTNAPCIEPNCAHPRRIGVFCSCCFERLQACAGFAAEWFGPAWTEACELAQEVSSHAAD